MAKLYNSKRKSFTTLNNGGSLSAGGTSVIVTSAAALPAAPFLAYIEPGVVGQEELVGVTNVASNTLTIVRALDGTTGVSHPDGSAIKNLTTSLAWQDMLSIFTAHTHTGSDSTLLLPNYYSPRNALANGDFAVWQKGTSFAAAATGTYNADMWTVNYSSTAVVTPSQITPGYFAPPNGINAPYGLNIAVTTADTSIAAGDYFAIESIIEGFDARALTGGFSISFWVKAHRTGAYSFSFRNSGFDYSCILEYTVSVADTWQYVTATVPALPTSGTWSFTTGKGLYVDFIMSAGTNFQNSPGAVWQGGNYISSINQVNGIGATSDVFSLALVNIIPGSVPQPLVPMPYAQELARAMRYRQIIADTTSQEVGIGQALSATVAQLSYRYPVEMLAAPGLTLSAASAYSLTAAGGGGLTCSVIVLNNTTSRSTRIDCTAATGLVAGNATRLVQNGAGSMLLEAYP